MYYVSYKYVSVCNRSETTVNRRRGDPTTRTSPFRSAYDHYQLIYELRRHGSGESRHVTEGEIESDISPPFLGLNM
jgi:hypothetical protein